MDSGWPEPVFGNCPILQNPGRGVESGIWKTRAGSWKLFKYSQNSVSGSPMNRYSSFLFSCVLETRNLGMWKLRSLYRWFYRYCMYARFPHAKGPCATLQGPGRAQRLGQSAAEGPQNSDSMFPSVQIPGYSSANSRFRVSEFPRPLCESAEGPQFPNSLFPREQIPGYSSANSRFQDSERVDSRILLGKFQIPSFRVSEAPSWVLGSKARGTPKLQIPSFQDFEALLLGPSQ